MKNWMSDSPRGLDLGGYMIKTHRDNLAYMTGDENLFKTAKTITSIEGTPGLREYLNEEAFEKAKEALDKKIKEALKSKLGFDIFNP